MNMNNIGKFEMRQILNEFDATLIRVYGVNMVDVAITRYQALAAYEQVRCAATAAENIGRQCGLQRQSA